MTLLDKIDAILKVLYEHSGDNPNFPLLEGWLKDVDIDKGEIRDILIKLKNEGLIYCEQGGQMNTEYSDYGRYLISFDGKYFLETEHGFKAKQAKTDAQMDAEQTAKFYHSEQADTLNRLTGWIAVASGMAALYYLLEIIKTVCKWFY